jgi:hypothetical protein
VGHTDLTFDFSAGDPATLDISVCQTPNSGTESFPILKATPSYFER